MDVAVGGVRYKALVDSDTEGPLIRSDLLNNVSYIGSINIQPIVGHSVPAKLAVLDLSKWDDDDNGEVQQDCRPLRTFLQ